MEKSQIVSLSRRKFLRRATAATTFAVVPRHVLGGAGHVPPSETITLAGIGMGGQGIQNMARLLWFSEVQAVAVCDVNREGGGYLSWNWNQGKDLQVTGREPGRRLVDEYYAHQKGTSTYRGCKAYADYRELFDREDIDAVMVATPDHLHAAITMAALAA